MKKIIYAFLIISVLGISLQAVAATQDVSKVQLEIQKQQKNNEIRICIQNVQEAYKHEILQARENKKQSSDHKTALIVYKNIVEMARTSKESEIKKCL